MEMSSTVLPLLSSTPEWVPVSNTSFITSYFDADTFIYARMGTSVKQSSTNNPVRISHLDADVDTNMELFMDGEVH
ncbi:hypothetical protein WR25_12419 [Diploscapter pachys]|uniref:Uncharacterized protein n=1 Tax=Diploscapter pachys TaxID=2018661 RepID=A0A2A2J4T0_9BILA|nr:hypothetical protein WR25_12419 [Diploscapter pachys]